MKDGDRYIVAVKRNASRETDRETPFDLSVVLKAIPGLVVEAASARRAQVLMTSEVLARLKADVGARVHIEPVIVHDRLSRE